MATRKTKSLISCTCEVCGKTFYASRPSKTCIDNSTCRVLKHQQKKKMDAIAAQFTMDLDLGIRYAKLIAIFPHRKNEIDNIILNMGVQTAGIAIHLAMDVYEEIERAIIEQTAQKS